MLILTYEKNVFDDSFYEKKFCNNFKPEKLNDYV